MAKAASFVLPFSLTLRCHSGPITKPIWSIDGRRAGTGAVKRATSQTDLLYTREQIWIEIPVANCRLIIRKWHSIAHQAHDRPFFFNRRIDKPNFIGWIHATHKRAFRGLKNDDMIR